MTPARTRPAGLSLGLALGVLMAATLAPAATWPAEGSDAAPVSPSAAAVGAASGAAAGEPRFDVAAVNAPVRGFFAALGLGTPYNLVLRPELQGRVTIRLRNVTLADTLAALQETYGFDFRPLAGGYVVGPAALQTRLFTIDYLDLERRGVSRTSVSSGQITQTGQHNGSGGASGGGNQLSGTTPDSGGAGAQQSSTSTGTAIATRSETDLWHELEANIRTIIGAEKGRSVVLNSMSGVLAVRATPRELRDVEAYLKRIQQGVSRQVVLEAKIIEVQLGDGYQAGINWAAIIRRGASTYTPGVSAPVNGFTRDLLTTNPTPITQTPGQAVTSLPGTSLGGAFTLAVNMTDFTAFIDLLSTQGATRVLSSPRVATLSNQKAIIKAGTDEFFVTNIQSNTVTGTASSTSRNVELTPFFSGIALDVLPQISAEGMVTLHIHPTVSTVTDQIKSLTVGGVTDQVPLAFSEVRESDSVVKARSGQVIVIGGLMRMDHSDSTYGTPGLSKVPAVGNLFKSRQRRDSKSELVILLRPVVVDDEGQWDALATPALDRAKALDPKATADLH